MKEFDKAQLNYDAQEDPYYWTSNPDHDEYLDLVEPVDEDEPEHTIFNDIL